MVSYKAMVVALLALSLLGAGCSSNDPDYAPLESSRSSVSEPENPYSSGSGHYAGFEWAERTGRTCGGNSQSFIEGCQEYYRQEEAYAEGE